MHLEVLKQKQMNKQVSDFYTPEGLHVYFKDPLLNNEVDAEVVISKVEAKIPAPGGMPITTGVPGPQAPGDGGKERSPAPDQGA